LKELRRAATLPSPCWAPLHTPCEGVAQPQPRLSSGPAARIGRDRHRSGDPL